MDVVIPLSPESIENRDILPAIKRIRLCVPNARIVVASRVQPSFLSDCVWVAAPDFYPNKDANQIDAIVAAIRLGVSAQFIRCSDDEVLISAEPVANHAGRIVVKPGGRWQRRLNNTSRWLLSKGFSDFNFDTHTPKVYDRDRFVEIFSRSPYQGHNGLTIESTYFNQL